MLGALWEVRVDGGGECALLKEQSVGESNVGVRDVAKGRHRRLEGVRINACGDERRDARSRGDRAHEIGDDWRRRNDPRLRPIIGHIVAARCSGL
ncbi:Uncharacterised protein [Chlamydia trachomatis]|nr:Uncharacterised protein [Chlamydia trachomatis]